TIKAHSDPVYKDLQVVSEPLKGLCTRLNKGDAPAKPPQRRCSLSKPFIPPNQIIMSQPANDNFSLHDDEELSLHDDASLDGSVPATNKGDAPAKPPQIQLLGKYCKQT
ncbi:hypothetical protein Tco_1518246, partial [Tanacetum coccineum]